MKSKIGTCLAFILFSCAVHQVCAKPLDHALSRYINFFAGTGKTNPLFSNGTEILGCPPSEVCALVSWGAGNYGKLLLGFCVAFPYAPFSLGSSASICLVSVRVQAHLPFLSSAENLTCKQLTVLQEETRARLTMLSRRPPRRASLGSVELTEPFALSRQTVPSAAGAMCIVADSLRAR